MPKTMPPEEEGKIRGSVASTSVASEGSESEGTAPEDTTSAPTQASHHWEQAQEDAWSEHTATAWALAHIIHRMYSTPLPPGLSPAQRRHFQRVIKSAAALVEAWQQQEREQAHLLAAARPTTSFVEDDQDASDISPERPPAHQQTRQRTHP